MTISIISPDHFIYNEEGIYEWSPERIKLAWEQAYANLEEGIESGSYKKIVLMGGLPAAGKTHWLEHNAKEGILYFDATFTNAWGRGKILKTIRNKSSEIPVEIVFLNTPSSLCRKRNSERSEDRKVPEAAIDRMASSLREDGFPKTEEGFSSVRIITSS